MNVRQPAAPLGAALLSGLLLSGALFAPGTTAGGGKAEQVLGKRDADGDGRIARDEWHKKRGFDEFDEDGDGYLTLEELEARFGEPEQTGSAEDRPDRISLAAIRRAERDDVAHQKARGLFETGLRPVWPAGVDCPGVDEWYAKDYTPKRPKESYHGGIDIPMPFGTPILAVMDGEVVAVYAGERDPRGLEVVLRHTPSESGLPVYLYTRYTHFDRMPEVSVGQRVKMGDVIGSTGNSGVQGCELIGKLCKRTRRPAIHFDVLYSTSEKYFDTGRVLVPHDAHWMDPNALFRKRMPVDSAAMRALPEDQKAVPVSYRLVSGEVYPADTRMIWPYACSGFARAPGAASSFGAVRTASNAFGTDARLPRQ